MKRPIFYLGNTDQPCIADYEVMIEDIDVFGRLAVFIYDRGYDNPGGTHIGWPEACEDLINRILSRELVGMYLGYIDFYLSWNDDHRDCTAVVDYEPVEDYGRFRWLRYLRKRKAFDNCLVAGNVKCRVLGHPVLNRISLDNRRFLCTD